VALHFCFRLAKISAPCCTNVNKFIFYDDAMINIYLHVTEKTTKVNIFPLTQLLLRVLTSLLREDLYQASGGCLSQTVTSV
jgi:hypothetical protein